MRILSKIGLQILLKQIFGQKKRHALRTLLPQIYHKT